MLHLQTFVDPYERRLQELKAATEASGGSFLVRGGADVYDNPCLCFLTSVGCRDHQANARSRLRKTDGDGKREEGADEVGVAPWSTLSPSRFADTAVRPLWCVRRRVASLTLLKGGAVRRRQLRPAQAKATSWYARWHGLMRGACGLLTRYCWRRRSNKLALDCARPTVRRSSNDIVIAAARMALRFHMW